MRQAGRNFRNERGNQIDIDVQDWYGDQVMIRLTGPHSSSMNLVTALEAEKLREALNEWAAS